MPIREMIMKAISKRKVQRQLYFIFFSALSIPILLIGSFLVMNTRKLLLEHYQTQINSDNLRVRSIMYDITTNIYNVSADLIHDQNLIELLSKTYTSESEVSETFQKYARQNSRHNIASIASIDIYSNSDIDISNKNATYAITLSNTDKVSEEDWYQKAVSQFSAFWISSISTDSGGNHYYELTLVRKIPLDGSSKTAVLCMKVNRNYLKSRIQNTDLFISTTINNDPVFFSTEQSIQDKKLPFFIDYESGYYNDSGNMEFKGTNVIGTISTLKPYLTDDYLYISTMDFEAYPNIRNIIGLCIGIILIAALLPMGMIFLFTKYFSSRIYLLRNAMHLASNGDYEIQKPFDGDDELTEVFSDLRRMIQKVKEKDAKVYQERINQQRLQTEQQKMEFKMLASQINPHFLYNTLETIRMQAFTSGNKEVANSIKLLGKSMHYVLENTGTTFTTLKKELDYIQTYLSIQKLRFGDRVNYTLMVAEGMNLENYQILPLLLQPIVENAILHGLEGIDKNGQILIDIAAEEGKYLKITIADNGIGMSAEKLEQLKKNMIHKDATDTSSIALYNVNRRILLCYGTDCKIEIYSNLGEGTQVILLLPFI